MKARILVTLTPLVVSAFLLNCGDADVCEGPQCVPADVDGGDALPPSDASTDGPLADGSKLPDATTHDGATEAGPPVCNLAADPKDSPACVVNADGIFVDAAGSDSNPGTMSAPVATIGKAVKLAKAATSRVYVCAGSYGEAVTITASVSVYGGFTCGTYAYSGVLPVVTAPAGSSALTVTGASGVSIEDMQWVSPDATGTDASGNGNSSIAAFLSSATVIIKRSSFKAGAGAAATPGSTQGASYTTAAQAGNPGTASSKGAGLTMLSCANGSGTTSSGEGGDPSTHGSGGGPGSSDPAISPAFPMANTGAGGGLDCSPDGPRGGSYGLGGTPGAAAASLGTLSASSWAPSPGGVGAPGGVGEGGGGGGSSDDTGGGGGGSAGGCGGDGGKGGAGGGASIGIALYQSALTLSSTTVQSGDGGGGGSGSKGGTGQNVSLGGGQGSTAACAGAVGGYGGSGGGGAGGTGGVSVGILWSGSAPTVDGNLTNNAVALAGITLSSSAANGGGVGSGGDAVASTARAGQPGATGAPGVSQAVLGL